MSYGPLTPLVGARRAGKGAAAKAAAAALRKLRDARPAKEAADDITGQLQRLVSKRFLQAAPYGQLQHFARYLKAVTARLDKLRADPPRDAERLAELRRDGAPRLH